MHLTAGNTIGAIWQCPEGHVLCTSCYDKVGGAASLCPSCSVVLSSIRSRVLERLRDKHVKKILAVSHSTSGLDAAVAAADGVAAQEVQLRIEQNIAAVAAAVAAAAPDSTSSEEEEDVSEVCGGASPEELDNLIRTSEHASTHIFVMFYIPNSKPCKRFMSVWDQLNSCFTSAQKVLVLKLNCSNQASACEQYRVTRFPTLAVFRPGSLQGEVLEAGVRADLNSLVQWIQSMTMIDPYQSTTGTGLGDLDTEIPSVGVTERSVCQEDVICDEAAAAHDVQPLPQNVHQHVHVKTLDADVRSVMSKARLGRRAEFRELICSDASLLSRCVDSAGNNLLLIAASNGKKRIV